MEEKINFTPIIQDIKNKKFDDAEKALHSLIDTTKLTKIEEDYACYLIGFINSSNENKNAKKLKAMSFLLKNINSENPIINSYVLYANLIEDKNISLNYINLGLQKFKNAPKLLKYKLKYLNDEERILQIIENRKNNIIDYLLIIEEIQICFDLQKWELLKKEADLAIKNFTKNFDILLDLKLIYSIAILMGNFINETPNVINILNEIIEKDVNNNYCYAPYLFLVYAYFLIDEISNGLKIYDKIPVNNSICNLDEGPFWIIEFDFSKIYNVIYTYLLENFNNDNDRLIKLKALYSLYLFKPYELSAVWNCSRKDMINIQKYYNSVDNSIHIGKALFSIYNYYNMKYNAFNILLDMLLNNYEVYDEINDLKDFFVNSSKEDFDMYIDCIIDLFEKSNNYFIQLKKLSFDLVYYLFQEKMYEKIVLFCDAINLDNVKNSFFEFFAAYSYSELNRYEESKELYTFIIENNPNDFESINNLGLIFEKEQNFEMALKLYEKSFKISQNTINSNNLSRIKKLISDKLKNSKKQKNKIIKQIGNRLSIDFFEKLGYDENLKGLLGNIANEQLRNILTRDLESAVIAIATRQYKSANILFGSMIEAILIYILDKNNINRYKLKNKFKNLYEMNLADLLEVAYSEKYIDKKNYQLALYIKDCRNSVHPHREIKDKLVFDEEFTMTSWNIFKNLINKLFINQ